MTNHITFPASPQQIVDFIGEAVHKQCRVSISFSNHTGETVNWSDLGFNPHSQYPLKIVNCHFLPSGYPQEPSDRYIIGMRLTKNWR